MADLRELKAIERRKKIRKMIRQGKAQTEMAELLDVDVTTISSDVAIIKEENEKSLSSNQKLVERDIEATLAAIYNLDQMDEEYWSIYYQTTKKTEKSALGTTHIIEAPQDAKVRLEALSNIRENVKVRSQLLKLLSPQQITIEKLVYIQNLLPTVLENYTTIVLQYVPQEKQVELLTKLQEVRIEGVNT